MKAIIRRLRYYYWFFSGFFKKYGKVVIVVFVLAFFVLFLTRSFADQFAYVLNINKKKIGLVVQGDKGKIPLEVLQEISSAIVKYDDTGQLKPGLAKRWKVEKGGRKFIFYFPQDIYWQDGSKFTVEDVDLNLFDLSKVKTEIKNPYSISFELEEPLVNFPSILTTPLVKRNFVGIGGSYRILRIKYNFGEIKRINLFPLKPGLPFLTYKIYNTSDDLILAYKLGEIDFFSTTDKEVVKLLGKWRNTKVSEVVDYKKIVTLFINTQKAPFDNKNLRQAVAQGIDYESLSKHGVRAYSPILPFSWAYNKDVKIYNFEPEISRGLIEKNNAGQTKIKIYSPYELNQVAEKINKNLKEIGLLGELRYTSYIPNDYDLFLTIWEPGIDPDEYIFWHQTQRGTNLSNFKNVKADKLLEDGRRELSVTKRKQVYFKFQELIAEEVPAVFIFYPKLFTVTRK